MVLESVWKTWFLYTHNDGPLDSAVDLVMLLAGATNLSSLLKPGTTPGRVWQVHSMGKVDEWLAKSPLHPTSQPLSQAAFTFCFIISSVKRYYETQANLPSVVSPHCLAEQEELILWSHHQGAAGTSHSINLLRLQGVDLVVTSYLSQCSPNQALASPQSTPPLGSGDKLKELTHPLSASFAKVNVTTSFTCNKLLEYVYWRANKYIDDGCHLCNPRTLKCSLKSAIQPKLADFGL